MRAHIRQCDSFPLFDWHDDPPQEVRALCKHLLRNTLSIFVFLLHLAVASSQFQTCPFAQRVIFRPVASFQRLTHERAIQPQVTNFSQELELLLSFCQLLSVSSCTTFAASSNHCLAYTFCDGESPPHFFEGIFLTQKAAHNMPRGLLSDHLCIARFRLAQLYPPAVITFPAKMRRVTLFRHDDASS